MPFDPTKPANNAPIVSAELRNQFNGLKALIDAIAPIGGVVAWLKDFPNTPALTNLFVECNGQVLNDVESPYHGATLPNLNGSGGGPQYFLRGSSTSGNTTGSDQHSHNLGVTTDGENATAEVDNNLDGATTVVAASGHTHNVTAQATFMESTLPTNYEVVWVMRVK